MTQKETVLNHLRQHGSISTWDCIRDYRITRLGAHIEVLRNDEGIRIEDVWETDGIKHWKRYLLINHEEVRQEYKVEKSGQLSIC